MKRKEEIEYMFVSAEMTENMNIVNNRTHYHTLDHTELDKHLMNDKVPTILVFTAEWLGSAQILDNFFAELSEEFHPTIRFLRIDIESSANLAETFGINKIPTTLILHKGNIVDYFTGMLPKNLIRNKLKQLK